MESWKRRNSDRDRFWWDRTPGEPLGTDLDQQKSPGSLYDKDVDSYLAAVELGGRVRHGFDSKDYSPSSRLGARLWAAQGVHRT